VRPCLARISLLRSFSSHHLVHRTMESSVGERGLHTSGADADHTVEHLRRGRQLGLVALPIF